MEDSAIIELYFARNEDAIGETDRKHGPACRRLALNLLQVREDAEECVSDTYHAAWNAIPPQHPDSLRAFLLRITRNLSVARLRAARAQKRYAGPDILLSELEECLPAREDTESVFGRAELVRLLTAWLQGLAPDDRALFLRRYWYGEAVKDLARELGAGENQTAQRMRRLRRSLRAALEEGGFDL